LLPLPASLLCSLFGSRFLATERRRAITENLEQEFCSADGATLRSAVEPLQVLHKLACTALAQRVTEMLTKYGLGYAYDSGHFDLVQETKR